MIYTTLFDFWDKQLSSNTSKRLAETFSSLYSNSIEDQWLGFSTGLILQLTTRQRDYQRIMFGALQPTEFTEYHIDPSVQSSFQLPGLGFGSVSSEGVVPQDQMPQGYIRSTPTQTGDAMEIESTQTLQRLSSNLLFKPTLSQVPQPTTTSTPPSQKRFIYSQFSLFFNIFDLIQQIISEFTKPTLATIRRRFKKGVQRHQNLTRSEQQKFQYKTRHREQFLTRTKIARSNQVSMKRKYRTGELPDIEIKLRELVEPLQVLSKFDANFARLLFPLLFKCVMDNVAEVSAICWFSFLLSKKEEWF